MWQVPDPRKAVWHEGVMSGEPIRRAIAIHRTY